MLPLAWGDLSLGLPGDLPGRPVLLALGMTALTAWIAVGIRRRPFDALLAALPLALAALFLGDVWLFPQGWLARRASAPPRRHRAGLGLGGRARRRRHRRPPRPWPGRPRSRPLVVLLVIAVAAVLPDRGVHPPTLAVWPAPAEWPTLRGGDPPSSPRPALERASRRHGPRPLSDVVAQARRQPGVVRAPQPRHQPGAPPDRPRDRERDVHASRADGRAVLHRPGDAASPHPDPGRTPRRPAPPRRAVGSSLAGELRPVRPQAPHRHRRRPGGPRRPPSLPRPRVRAGRRGGGLHPLRAARPSLAARRADHLAALPRPPVADGRRVDPHRHRRPTRSGGSRARRAGSRPGWTTGGSSSSASPSTSSRRSWSTARAGSSGAP